MADFTKKHLNIRHYRVANEYIDSAFLKSASSSYINDIQLSIKPENIQVAKTGNSSRIPVSRAKSAIKIQQGRSDFAVMMSIPFISGPSFTYKDNSRQIIWTSYPFSNWNYKLKPLIIQISKNPLITVEDEFLLSQLDKKFTNANVTVPLIVENFSVSTIETLPDTLLLNLNCSYANVKPFTDSLYYRTVWNHEFENDPDISSQLVDNNGLPLLRISNGKYDTSSIDNMFTPFARRSQAFYDFHFKELVAAEENAITTYNNDTSIIFREYFQLDVRYFSTKEASEQSSYARSLDSSGLVTIRLRGIENNVASPTGSSLSGRLEESFHKQLSNTLDTYLAARKNIANTNNPLGIKILLGYIEPGSDSNPESTLYAASVLYNQNPDGSINNTVEILSIGHLTGQAVLLDFTDLASRNPDLKTDFLLFLKNQFKVIKFGNREYYDVVTYNTLTTPIDKIGLSKELVNIITQQSVISNQKAVQDGLDKIRLDIARQLNNFNSDIQLSELSLSPQLSNTQKLIFFREQVLNFLDASESKTVTPSTNIEALVKTKTSNNLLVGSVSASISSNIVKLGMDYYDYPTFQYMGGLDVVGNMMIYAHNAEGHKAIKELQSVFDRIKENIRLYKGAASLSGMGIRNSFLNKIMGITDIYIENIVVGSVPQNPTLWTMELSLTDVTENKNRSKDLFKSNLTFANSRNRDQAKRLIELFLQDISEPYQDQKTFPLPIRYEYIQSPRFPGVSLPYWKAGNMLFSHPLNPAIDLLVKALNDTVPNYVNAPDTILTKNGDILYFNPAKLSEVYDLVKSAIAHLYRINSQGIKNLAHSDQNRNIKIPVDPFNIEVSDQKGKTSNDTRTLIPVAKEVITAILTIIAIETNFIHLSGPTRTSGQVLINNFGAIGFCQLVKFGAGDAFEKQKGGQFANIKLDTNVWDKVYDRYKTWEEAPINYKIHYYDSSTDASYSNGRSELLNPLDPVDNIIAGFIHFFDHKNGYEVFNRYIKDKPLDEGTEFLADVAKKYNGATRIQANGLSEQDNYRNKFIANGKRIFAEISGLEAEIVAKQEELIANNSTLKIGNATIGGLGSRLISASGAAFGGAISLFADNIRRSETSEAIEQIDKYQEQTRNIAKGAKLDEKRITRTNALPIIIDNLGFLTSFNNTFENGSDTKSDGRTLTLSKQQKQILDDISKNKSNTNYVTLSYDTALENWAFNQLLPLIIENQKYKMSDTNDSIARQYFNIILSMFDNYTIEGETYPDFDLLFNSQRITLTDPISGRLLAPDPDFYMYSPDNRDVQITKYKDTYSSFAKAIYDSRFAGHRKATDPKDKDALRFNNGLEFAPYEHIADMLPPTKEIVDPRPQFNPAIVKDTIKIDSKARGLDQASEFKRKVGDKGFWNKNVNYILNMRDLFQRNLGTIRETLPDGTVINNTALVNVFHSSVANAEVTFEDTPFAGINLSDAESPQSKKEASYLESYIKQTDLRKRIASKMYPAFKLFFLEEDSDNFWLSYDDFYGVNTVQEIRIVKQKDNPADLCYITLVDLTGTLTGQKYRNEKDKFIEANTTKDPGLVDTIYENPIRNLMIKDGMSIQVRLGYSNTPDSLTTEFNGRIVSVESYNSVVTIMAQSYGTELVQTIFTKEDNPGNFSFNKFIGNADTNEILSFIMARPELKHFGRWKIGDSLVQFGRYRADGKLRWSWRLLPRPTDDNIMAPTISDFDQWSRIVQVLGLAFLTAGLSYITNKFTFYDFDFDGYTIWDVFRESMLRHPGMIALPVPYENRMTMFYGMPNSNYIFRDASPITKYILSDQTRYDNFVRNLASNFSVDLARPGNFANQLKQSEDEVKKLTQNLNRTKKFRQYWLASSQINIVHNQIKADFRGVYNKINVLWDNDSNVTEVEMNPHLMDNEVRSTNFSFKNIKYSLMAIRYGTAILQQQAQKLYKGALTIIGEPGVKPYDIVNVFDFTNQNYGPIEVAEVVQTYSTESGFTTTIIPDMVVTTNSRVDVPTNDAFLALMAGYTAENSYLDGAIDFQNLAVGGSGVALGIAGATAALTSGAVLSSGAAASAASIFGISATGVATAVGIVPIAAALIAGVVAAVAFNHKIMEWGIKRYPIVLSPMTKNGVPFIYGLNSWVNNLTLMQSIDREWNIMMEDTGRAYEQFKRITDAFFNPKQGLQI